MHTFKCVLYICSLALARLFVLYGQRVVVVSYGQGVVVSLTDETEQARFRFRQLNRVFRRSYPRAPRGV